MMLRYRWGVAMLAMAAVPVLGQGALAPAPAAEPNFEQLKAQVFRQCLEMVQPDVLKLVAGAFAACRDSAEREREVLAQVLQAKQAQLQHVQALALQIQTVDDELATLAQRREALEKQVLDQRHAFAAGADAPDGEALKTLEATEAQIAQKKAAQRQRVGQYYKLPRLSQLQRDTAEYETKIADAAARCKRWIDEIQKANDMLAAVSRLPKRTPFELLAAGGRLDKPACNIGKHWIAPDSGRLNLILTQMEHGQILGAAMQPEPLKIYDAYGLIYADNVSLKLVNKDNPADSLTFAAKVILDPATRRPMQLKGTAKSDTPGAAEKQWAFR